MKFAILENLQKDPPPPEPENLPSEVPTEPEKPTEPERKIPFERLLGLINTYGLKLADDYKITIEEKVDAWVDYLKWILPHIPDDQQQFKAEVKDMIKNPSQWDFMEKPKRHTLQRGRPFHYRPRER